MIQFEKNSDNETHLSKMYFAGQFVKLVRFFRYGAKCLTLCGDNLKYQISIINDRYFKSMRLLMSLTKREFSKQPCQTMLTDVTYTFEIIIALFSDYHAFHTTFMPEQNSERF